MSGVEMSGVELSGVEMSNPRIIRRPVTETAISEFEQLQKKSIKVDTQRRNLRYDEETYLTKCYQVQLSPMKRFFDINDLKVISTRLFMGKFQLIYQNTYNPITDKVD